jgi:hypothetical protein
MVEFIESIVLSQLLVFLLLMGILLSLTQWAWREKEYAGYALGWLVGILLILMYGSLTGGISTPAENTDDFDLSFFTVVIPSFFGIITGYGVLYFLEAFRGSGQNRRRSLTIAILTTLDVFLLYIVFDLSGQASRIIGIFALGFAIGALFNRVLDSTAVPTRGQFETRDEQGPRMQPFEEGPPSGNRQPPSIDPNRDRFDNLRRPPPDRRR